MKVDKDDFVVDADDGEDENDEDFKPDIELKKSSPRKKSAPKGQIMSECIYEIIDFPKYHRKNLIDFCSGRFYRLGTCDLF